MDIYGWCKNDHKNEYYLSMYMNGKSLVCSCITRKYTRMHSIARYHTRILLVIPLKVSDIAIHILGVYNGCATSGSYHHHHWHVRHSIQIFRQK